MTDPISDMLTRIRNANNALLPKVEMPASKMKQGIASILKKEGYIEDFSVQEAGKGKKSLLLNLKYQGKKQIIRGLKRISKPGLRQYSAAAKIPIVLGGIGVAVISTSNGLMTAYHARKQNNGGEILFYIW
ncbi:MAG TPA: 30S ribosomal protein S8 [Verrucomicrobiales bacterium]|nr:30S ribosomal protein S8 [Verrucomicrobiales bacterium]